MVRINKVVHLRTGIQETRISRWREREEQPQQQVLAMEAIMVGILAHLSTQKASSWQKHRYYRRASSAENQSGYKSQSARVRNWQEESCSAVSTVT